MAATSPAPLLMASMATDGTVWAIDTNQTALRLDWKAGAFVAAGDRLMAKISVGSATQIWGIDTKGQPVRLQANASGGTWQNMGAPSLSAISAAADGTVWGIDPANKPVRWNGNGWDAMPGQATLIDVGSQAIVWSVDPTGTPQSWTGTAWQARPALGQSIAGLVAGSDTHVWALSGGKDQKLYMFDGVNQWRSSDWGPLTAVGGGDSYSLVGVTPTHSGSGGNKVNELWFGSYGPLPQPKPAFMPPQRLPGINLPSAPALAALNDNQVFCGFPADDPSNILYVTNSTDGKTWLVPARGYGAITVGTAVSMATLNNVLYCVFGANARDPRLAPQPLCMTSSSDGATWSAPQSFPNVLIPDMAEPSVLGAPALAVFKGKLWCAYASGYDTVVVSSYDGRSWAAPTQVYSGMQPYGGTMGAPALASLNGQLFCAIQRQPNTGNAGIFVLSSPDGQTWSAGQQIGGPQHTLAMSANSPPALVAFRGRLYCAVLTPYGWLCMTSTTDGQHWEEDLVTYPNFNSSSRYGTIYAPAFAVMNDALYVAVQEPDTQTLRVSMANTYSSDASQPLPPPPPIEPPPPPGPGAMS